MVKEVKIPKGYKKTEIGIIPKQWSVQLLGEVTLKVGSGITPPGGEKVYKKEGRPFIRSQNVGWGNLLMDDIAFIDDKTHETFKATEIRKFDVFLNITGASIGRSAVADHCVENGNVNQHVCIIRTDRQVLDPFFLNYFLLSKAGQQQIDSYQAGGNRQGLNFGQIKSFNIPIPPILEQQAIAEALSDVDALIASLERLITKKRHIKQGAMQQLLTGQTRLPGFSDEWELKILGEIAPLQRGFDLPTSQITNGCRNRRVREKTREICRDQTGHDARIVDRTNPIEQGSEFLIRNGMKPVFQEKYYLSFTHTHKLLTEYSMTSYTHL